MVNSSTLSFYTDAKLQSEVLFLSLFSLFSLSLSLSQTHSPTLKHTHSLFNSLSLPPALPYIHLPLFLIVSIPKIRLKRPVTDCEGRALIVGGADIPRFGDIPFFPRQLSTREMVEIMSAGFTFESLAAGKMPFAPVCHFMS